MMILVPHKFTPYVLMATAVTFSLVLGGLGPVATPARDRSMAPRGASAVVVEGLQLASPRAIAVTDEGAIVIADAGDPASGVGGQIIVINRERSGFREALNGATNMVSIDTGFGIKHIHGLSGVAAASDGSIYFVVGQGAWLTDPLGGPNQLYRWRPDNTIEAVLDLGLLEAKENPDQGLVESNANSVTVAGDGSIWVSDAGGNWVAELDSSGSVRAVTPFAAVDGQDAVPTGLLPSLDGGVLVALFRCHIPTEGRGGVVLVDKKGEQSTVVPNLSNPIAIDRDGQGNFYVLEYSVDYKENSGRVLKIGTDGQREILFEGLNNPTGIVVAGESVLVTEMASPAGGKWGSGQVLEILIG